jgi:hypothetical protein
MGKRLVCKGETGIGTNAEQPTREVRDGLREAATALRRTRSPASEDARMRGGPRPAIVAAFRRKATVDPGLGPCSARAKGVNVNRFWIPSALAAGLSVAALATGSALAGSGSAQVQVPFRGTFAGKAVVRVTGESADITAGGIGPARILGKSRISGTLGRSKLVGKGVGNKSDPCPLFGGNGSITAATGAKLNFTVPPAAGSGCTDEQAQLFSLSGRARVTGGTGKYARTKGVLRFSGSFDRGTGNFTVAFTGTLTA